MIGLLIIVGVTAMIGLLLWLHDKRGRNADSGSAEAAQTPGTQAASEASEPQQQQCCGLHLVCEKDSLSPFSTKIDYYDDEELDRFASRGADDYSDQEIEEFREVLLTMRVEDIAGWSRSLQLRGIQLPGAVRDELLLIVSEARTNQ